MPELARHLGDHPLPHGQRHEPLRLEIVSQHGEDRGRCKDDVTWFHAIDSSRARASIAPYASPRHREEGGIAHEVEQVAEPTLGAVGRPSVQLGLDSQYPGLGFFERRPWCVGVHRRPPGIPVPSLRTRWVPSPCTWLSHARTTTDPPPHPGAVSRRRACPSPCRRHEGKGDPRAVPMFTMSRSAGSTSSYAAAASPRLRRRLSPWPPRRHQKSNAGVVSHIRIATRTPLPSPHPPGSSWIHA